MKLFTWRKEGGPQSRVHGFFVVEIKSLFSIVLLHFKDGTRDAYHSHAFGAVSWLLRGHLREYLNEGHWGTYYWPSLKPIWTPRSRMHKVASGGTSWVLSFRGPWAKTWEEYIPAEDRRVTFTNGRKVVS